MADDLDRDMVNDEMASGEGSEQVGGDVSSPGEDVSGPAEVAGDAVLDVDSAAFAGPEEAAAESASQASEEAPQAEEVPKEWYVLKVQVNREDSIRDGLERRVKLAGLEEYFGRILVPAEKVTEVRGGRKRTTRRKLLPGYIIVQMVINDDTWFVVRETPGVGDFTGSAGKPTPMEPHEVQRLLATEEVGKKDEPKIKIGFKVGDRVKINNGTFENFEGDVHAIDDTNGIVWVMINIFGRSTPVRFEYWQIEAAG